MSPALSEPQIQFFTTKDGLRLAYDEAGVGPPLLCLAGLTRNRTDFDFVHPQLIQRCRTIRLDTRGRGRSDYDSDYRNYTILREAQDALELLDHLGIARTAILGTSRGGMIALLLAAMNKDRLRGVCLNDIGPKIEPDGLAYILSYITNPTSYDTLDEAAKGIATTLAEWFPGVSLDRWRTHAEHLWTVTDAGLELRYDQELRRLFMDETVGETAPDLWQFFDALDGLPVGLVRGANSNILSAETAAEMQRRRPDMIYADVPDRGHVPFLDEREALQVIEGFISQLGGAEPG